MMMMETCVYKTRLYTHTAFHHQTVYGRRCCESWRYCQSKSIVTIRRYSTDIDRQQRQKDKKNHNLQTQCIVRYDNSPKK